MIISYTSHKKIKIENNGLKILATINPTVYCDLVQGFQMKNKLLVCSNDEYENLEIKKNFDFFGDVLLNKNFPDKYMPEIIKSYVQNMDEVNRNRILHSFNNLINTLQDSLLFENLPLEIDYIEDLKKILRLENLHLDFTMINRPYDIINTVLRIHQMCDLETIPIICNAGNYLTKQEMIELSKTVKQMNLILILIEFKNKDFAEDLENTEFYYIDEDFVDWY